MDILLIKTENIAWSEVSGFMGSLSPARRKAVLKKQTDEDRVNALISKLLLLSELEKRTGKPQRRIAFTYGTHKKPYLAGDELYFSLSHTKGAVAAAFSESGEIGIDIERKDREVPEKIYKRVLSDEESLKLTGNADFLRYWVQKEAFLKRLGIGITRELRGVNSFSLPDTAAIDCGEYFIGASGKGALDAVVLEVPLSELLSRFVLLDQG